MDTAGKQHFALQYQVPCCLYAVPLPNPWMGGHRLPPKSRKDRRHRPRPDHAGDGGQARRRTLCLFRAVARAGEGRGADQAPQGPYLDAQEVAQGSTIKARAFLTGVWWTNRLGGIALLPESRDSFIRCCWNHWCSFLLIHAMGSEKTLYVPEDTKTGSDPADARDSTFTAPSHIFPPQRERHHSHSFRSVTWSGSTADEQPRRAQHTGDRPCSPRPPRPSSPP